MRYIFVFFSLLSFWILPNQILAESKTMKSIIPSEQGSQITNKLIELFKKCQNFNRKIASKNSSIKTNFKKNPVKKFMTRKPKLSIVSSKIDFPRKTEVTNRVPKSIRTSTKQRKTSWSFVNLFSQLYGPAPFARR
tara:strand:+ start:1060 stop:1467 length:408 start_codon:yes stop_codon:yes gene_type:complete